MKTILLGALLLLAGFGCAPAAPTTAEARLATEQVTQFITMPDYRLPVPADYAFQKNGNYVRIQNYQGQSDPDFDYGPGVFFVEIDQYPELNADYFRSRHALTEDATLGGEPVLRGTNRIANSTDTWPGHSYYNEAKNVVIYLYYNDADGSEKAEDLVQQILWQ